MLSFYQNRRTFLFFLSLLITTILHSQKGYFEEVVVEDFAPPYEELIISVFGVEQPVLITKKTKIKGEKSKKLEPAQLEEGALITKLSYEIDGEDFVAEKIDTDISADGSIRVSGLFEGMSDGLARIDGYPVKLRPGILVEGEKNIFRKKSCDCAGVSIPSFDHPLLQPGTFYVDVKGFKDENGIITAEEATLCRNTFAGPERELLAAVNSSLTDNTSKVSHVPSGVFKPPMGLYNGQVEVGQYSYPLTDNIELQGYVNQVGHRLIPDHSSEQQHNGGEVSFRFYVIDDPVPNAFAFPNGMIFVHTGLLDIMENEAQLAIVLGHEIAHVTHEHGRERYEKNKIIDDVTGVADAFIGKALKIQFQRWAPGLSPDMLNTVTTLSSNITPAAISNIIKPQTTMESQADRVGLFYAHEAGYDIREAAKFWNKMQELTGNNSFQQEVTSQLVSSLKSDRLNFSSLDQNPIQKLGSAVSDVVAKQILNTIYTSHPKAKKRARAVNKLVSTVYADTNWEDLKVREEAFAEMMDW